LYSLPIAKVKLMSDIYVSQIVTRNLTLRSTLPPKAVAEIELRINKQAKERLKRTVC
jgi:hypothetical protein